MNGELLIFKYVHFLSYFEARQLVPSLYSNQTERPESDRVSAKYIAATVNHISNGIAVSDTMLRPSVVKSKIAMTLTMEEFLIRETTSLVRGGRIRWITCGRITSL